MQFEYSDTEHIFKIPAKGMEFWREIFEDTRRGDTVVLR